MKSGLVLIFMSIASFFLIACSSPPSTPPTFIHVVPNYQEIVAYDTPSFYASIPSLQAATSKQPLADPRPQTPNLKLLSDAGLPCRDTYDCIGSCLALERNATLGFCSDTRTPLGCAEYLIRRNVTMMICN